MNIRIAGHEYEDVDLNILWYSNSRPAILAMGSDGTAVAKLTINLPYVEILSGELVMNTDHPMDSFNILFKAGYVVGQYRKIKVGPFDTETIVARMTKHWEDSLGL